MESEIKHVRFTEDVKSFDGKTQLTLYFEYICWALSQKNVVINDICNDVPFNYWIDIFCLLCSLMSRIEKRVFKRYTLIMINGGSFDRIRKEQYALFLIRITKLCFYLFKYIPHIIK